ncbi:hypothetical protein HY411_00675 [Candidatus Gottesmanbacteria bacterium]|nr:hypothetical protein [Candidatus Gottesmanbacteria bacterium]
MVNYSDIWERYSAVSLLSEEDAKEYLVRLHEELKAGLELMGSVAGSEVVEILKDVSVEKKDALLQTIATILTYTALAGYTLYLVEHGVNPLGVDLKDRETTKGLGSRWMEGYKKDQHQTVEKAIDPIIKLMLDNIRDIRTNQLLALRPDIIDLPYKTSERVFQYLGWAAHEGYILAVLESQLGKHD